MKKNLTILLALAMVLAVAAPSLAGEWKFSGWALNENTYTDGFGKEDVKNDYTLKARLGATKTVDDLTYTYILEARGKWDNDFSEFVHRQITVDYAANDTTTVRFGKYPFWAASGLLGDDFVNAVQVNTKFNDQVSATLMHGNVSAGPDRRVTYANATFDMNPASFGLHILRGENQQFTGLNPLIILGEANYKVNDDLTLTAMFGKADVDKIRNTDVELKEDDILRLQASYTGFEKTTLRLRYLDMEADASASMPVGYNSLGHDKAIGRQGFSLFAGYALTDVIGLEATFESYEATTDGEGFKKGDDTTRTVLAVSATF